MRFRGHLLGVALLSTLLSCNTPQPDNAPGDEQAIRVCTTKCRVSSFFAKTFPAYSAFFAAQPAGAGIHRRDAENFGICFL